MAESLLYQGQIHVACHLVRRKRMLKASEDAFSRLTDRQRPKSLGTGESRPCESSLPPFCDVKRNEEEI